LLVTLPLALALRQSPRLPSDTLPADFGAQIPRGLVTPGTPDTAPSPAVLALGRALFFDPILSADNTISCASCHDPAHGFADASPLSLGIHAQRTLRHTPSLFNRGFGRQFSWTGVTDSLEKQVLLPIENPLEMGTSTTAAVERLRADEKRTSAFESAFGSPPTSAHLATALAAFVARIHSGDSAVDRFQSGDFTALTDDERAGLWIYESKGACWRCHSGPNYTDEDFHATGVGAMEESALPGRFEITSDERDRGRFKTPTLRGLAFTAPYMHDGSIATLTEVIAYYDRGANPCAQLDERIKPLALAAEEKRALVAFLLALSRPAGS
jgi:cytochrome c peroxidase